METLPSVRRRQVLRRISWLVLTVMVSATIFSSVMYFPNATAAGLALSVGNVKFTINDFGVITNDISWSMKSQTHMVYKSYLTIYHSAYPSGGGSTDVATGYGSGTGDFTVDEANIYVQSDTVQETYSSFRQTGVAGVSNDLKIYQMGLSKENENWAILTWKLENIYGTSINNLRVGMNFRTRLADTPGDDIDYWNAADSMYYIEDQPTMGTLMGFSSADQTIPLNHYYGAAAGKVGAVDPTDDKTLYQSLMTNKVNGATAEMTCMVGWEIGTLPAGANVSLPLIITFGTRYQDLTWAASKAKEFLILQYIDTVVTEIQDFSSTDNVKIEIYNQGERGLATSDIYLSPNGFDAWDAGMWDRTSVAPGQYAVYSLGPGEAFSSYEGGRVSLHYSTGYQLDLVSFGQMGTVPDPLRDESVARYWNGVNYSNDWVRDPTPTFGAGNDRQGRLDPPPIVLNEVGFNMNAPQDRFIELYYPGTGGVVTTGWTLVVDSQYPLPSVMLDTIARFFVLRGEDFPLSFGMNDGSSSGDNVYLYDDQGRLVDMVGWSTAHVKGQTMDRVSDPAQWGYEGYSDTTSTADGWRFGRIPTPQILDLGPDRSKMIDVGQTATYDISAYYSGSSPDVLDVTFVSSLGWATDITDPVGNPISDTDGDTVPDLGPMSTGVIKSFKVEVTAPLDPKTGNLNVVYLTATSSVNTGVTCTLTLRTTAVVPPYVILNETVDPDTIWLEGSPVLPQEATLTLNVTGAGTPLIWFMPQDTVFVIDNSGSMSTNDPLNLRLSGAKAYVDMMKIPDRAATVRFTDTAALVNGHHLSANYAQVKADIDSFPSPLGATNIPSGLAIATDEHIAYGDPSHVLVEILLTDGRNTAGINPDARTLWEAQRAADNGIIIFTIGLLVGGDVNEQLLQQVADITGGTYHPAPTADALKDIYLGIFEQVMNIAGKKIVDPINPNPMIKNVLPPYIQYVPGSFRDASGNSLLPSTITTNPDGSTALDWDVDRIFINQTWIVKFEVTSSLDGYVAANCFPESRVNYTKWDNSTTTVPFPEVFITVLAPEPVNPPILGITADQDDVHLAWTVPGPNISYYLIYRATDQRDFDFSSPIHSTLSDPDPTATTWTDPGAASPNPREYYYTVRAVNNLGIRSITSNTVGKFTRVFDAGLNSFSLPLKPIVGNKVEWYASSIPNTIYIDWMESNDKWVRHWKGSPSIRSAPLRVGEGYQIFVSGQSEFTFVGLPASMIKFFEGLGSPTDFAKGLDALPVGNNLVLYWKPATGAYGYAIYKSSDRMAFHQGGLSPVVTLGPTVTSWTDNGALSNEVEWHYMVLPLADDGKEGSSTFSIGVILVRYMQGHTSMGLPLKPNAWWTLDHYSESMVTAVGIAYMVMGVWKLHSTAMPPGVYDPFIEQGQGYQVSVSGAPGQYVYIGF